MSQETGHRPRDETDVRPVVASARRGVPGWVFAAIIGLAGLLLFLVLDSRRRALNAPAVTQQRFDVGGTGDAPPALYIPPEIVPSVAPTPLPSPSPAAAPDRPAVAPPPAAPVQMQPAYVPQAPLAQTAAQQPARVSSAPALVIDGGAPAVVAAAEGGAASASGAGASKGASANTARARAGVFANRANTVPQGTLLPAVLESALDTTHGGLARAIVSRDVRGFDGTLILIPRGSRLIGEYGSDVEAGQKRALVNWVRLIRPDGATIAIGSPAADPLGGTGIRARVNSHFFERFAGAILQSSLDIGVNLAARAADSPVILALPGTVQNSSSQLMQQRQVTPTLTVRQGTSISVFVARDLDFSGSEGRR